MNKALVLTEPMSTCAFLSKMGNRCFLNDFMQNASSRALGPYPFKINPDEGRTFSNLDGIILTPGTSQVWKKSFESQLAEQTLFNNIVNVFLNLIIRNIGEPLLNIS